VTRATVLQEVDKYPLCCTRMLLRRSKRLSRLSYWAVTSMLYKLEKEGLLYRTSNPAGGWVNPKTDLSGLPDWTWSV